METGVEGLDGIRELWENLSLHHKERSIYFKAHFDAFMWKERKTDLINKTGNGNMLVNLAKDKNISVGYCVSTVNERKIGEIESIFIAKKYRKQNIGDHFMKTAVKWMDEHEAVRKVTGVAAGNEEVFGFYQKYGFYLRSHTLAQVENKH